MPGRPTVLRQRPRHNPMVEPGRHGPDTSQAVLCLDRAKSPRRGLGILVIYTYAPSFGANMKMKHFFISMKLLVCFEILNYYKNANTILILLLLTEICQFLSDFNKLVRISFYFEIEKVNPTQHIPGAKSSNQPREIPRKKNTSKSRRIDFYLVRDMALLARPLGEEAHERKMVRLVAFAVEEKKTHTRPHLFA